MSATPEQFIATAASQIGVKESPRGSNKVLYSRWFKLIGPWCAMFVAWCAVQCGAGDPRSTVTALWASCEQGKRALKRKGLVRANKRDAKPGDVVFFQFDSDSAVDHIGIITAVSAAGIATIEGNTSSTTAGSQSNGGMVARRSRPWSVVDCVATLPGISATATPAPKPPAKPTPPTTTTPPKEVPLMPALFIDTRKTPSPIYAVPGDGTKHHLTQRELDLCRFGGALPKTDPLAIGDEDGKDWFDALKEV